MLHIRFGPVNSSCMTSWSLLCFTKLFQEMEASEETIKSLLELESKVNPTKDIFKPILVYIVAIKAKKKHNSIIFFASYHVHKMPRSSPFRHGEISTI